MAKDRQSSWASGELSPDLYGQAGSPVYRTGAGLLRNFLVTPQALPVNRTGSVHLATLGSKTARLVPFLFGDDPVRLVQLYARGQFVMRDENGAYVEGGADDTSGDSITPTREAVLEDLRRLRVAQCAGTMMVTGATLPGFGQGALYDIKRSNSGDYVGPMHVIKTPPEFGSSSTPFSSTNSKRDRKSVV